MKLDASTPTIRSNGIDHLVARLDAAGSELNAATLGPLLRHAALCWDDVAPFVRESASGYTRRCIVRRESYEIPDPGALLSIQAIAPDESVVILGTG